MTQLFYNHAGATGAQKHYPRSMSVALRSTAIESPLVDDMGTTEARQFCGVLDRTFPSGFQCWAVPTGAQGLFKKLDSGDVFLLIGRIQIAPYPDGAFDYVARIALKAPVPLPTTSAHIWDEARWPLVFFFEAKPISLPWPIFIRDVGYKPNWNPQGRFYRVNPDQYPSLPGGDPDGYFRHILSTYV